ncbi:MAG: hypothetical protein U5K37_07470 [Natrialbaceae archaeon]|nr:hypothetical protein [Natrialbaceae archaeon]
MDSRTVERIERWDARPFESGYETLDSLASADFSGAVTAGGAWLFMLNGRIVGVEEGRLEDFKTRTGSIYEAPDPGVPLLMAIQAAGGEPRARYYTEKTPLESVDKTLQDGGFTGYVELSEDVLSGDYYLIYYGGRRMAAAWVGAAERLLTDRAGLRAGRRRGGHLPGRRRACRRPRRARGRIRFPRAAGIADDKRDRRPIH